MKKKLLKEDYIMNMQSRCQHYKKTFKLFLVPPW